MGGHRITPPLIHLRRWGFYYPVSRGAFLVVSSLPWKQSNLPRVFTVSALAAAYLRQDASPYPPARLMH